MTAGVLDDRALVAVVDDGGALEQVGLLKSSETIDPVEPLPEILGATAVATADGFAIGGYQCIKKSEGVEEEECDVSRSVVAFVDRTGGVLSVSVGENVGPGASPGDPSAATPDGVVVLGAADELHTATGRVTHIEPPKRGYTCGADHSGTATVGYVDVPDDAQAPEDSAGSVQAVKLVGGIWRKVGDPIRVGSDGERHVGDIPHCVVGGAVVNGHVFTGANGFKELATLQGDLERYAVGITARDEVLVANESLLVAGQGGQRTLAHVRGTQAWTSPDGGTALYLSSDGGRLEFIATA